MKNKQTLILVTSAYRFSNLERVASYIKDSYDESIEYVRSNFNLDIELIWAVGVDVNHGFGTADIDVIQSRLGSSGIKSIFIEYYTNEKYDPNILNYALKAGKNLTSDGDPYWMCLDDDNIIVPILFPVFAECITNTNKDIIILSMLYEWSITQNLMEWYYNHDALNPDPSRTIMRYSIWEKYGRIHEISDYDEVYDLTWYQPVVESELQNNNVFFSPELSNHLIDKISTRHNGLLSESDWNEFDSMLSMPSLNSWINIDAFGIPECKRCIDLPTDLVKKLYPIIRQYYIDHPLK